MPTGAGDVLDALRAEGVEVCFGLPGVHNLALWEALRESGIRLVGVRHEQAAAYAADGYARATGRLGVALTTTGPGAANTLGAVGEAWAARSPVLVVATDIPSTLRRPGAYRGVLHETDGQAAMFAPVVKATHVAHRAQDVARAAAAAVDAAVSAPTRPVYLEISTDLLAAPVDAGEGVAASGAGPRTARAGAADPGALAAAAALLARAERPLIWAGGGARDAAPAVRALAERLAAPVITTYGAAGVLGADHPCRVGLPPHVEQAGGLWDDADVVVAIGSDLDGVQTQNFAQPQPPSLVAINLDAPGATTNYRADVLLEGDAAVCAAALAERIDPRGGLEELGSRLRARRAEALAGLDGRALAMLDVVGATLPDDGVLVLDMCIPGYWLAGFHTARAPRRVQVPLGWGTLGYAMPAAMGAALAGVGPTVAVCGDGGVMFALGELATIAQERIPLTVVIVDDGGYGMLRYDQEVSDKPTYGVDLLTPDFATVASACGLRAQTVDGLGDAFGEALAAHVADPHPSVLVARTPVPLPPPPNTSPNWYRT